MTGPLEGAQLVDAIVEAIAEAVARKLRASQPADEWVTRRTAPCGPTVFVRGAAKQLFPAVKVGREYRAKRADVERWMATQRPAAPRPKPAPLTGASVLRANGLTPVRRIGGAK